MSIELDPKTAWCLADIAHRSVMSSNIFMAKANPKAKGASSSGTVKLDMDSDTANEIAKKINAKLLASGAFMG